MGIFAEIDSGEVDGSGDNYSDTNNSSFVNADTGDSIFNSDTLINGDGTLNTVPTVSDNPQVATPGTVGAGTTQNLLGSVGSLISNLPKTATAIGTAVGNAQHNIAQAGTNYTAAQQAAASGNNLGTWWQYASNTDKAMIILAVVGIVVAYEKG